MPSTQVFFLLFLWCAFTISFAEQKIAENGESNLEQIGKHSLSRIQRSATQREEDDSDPYFDTFHSKPSSSNAQLDGVKSPNNIDESQVLEKCGTVQAIFTAKHNTIIKTKESMNNGARFIISPHVHSNQECIDKCCSESECSLSVYDGKGKTSCYLFDCSKPNSCNFTTHKNYTSTHIQRLPPAEPEKPPVEVERENELEDLKQLVPMEKSRDDEIIVATTLRAVERPTPTVRATTTITTTTTTTTVAPTTVAPTTSPPLRQVHLLETCSYHSDCADKYAVCDNVCICKPGMKPSYGKCALVQQSTVCNHLQFTCRTTPRDRDTHCIASYDVCDGIAQCPLGDDEVNCQGGSDEASSRHSIQRRPGVDRRRPWTTRATLLAETEQQQQHEQQQQEEEEAGAQMPPVTKQKSGKEVEPLSGSPGTDVVDDRTSAGKPDEDASPEAAGHSAPVQQSSIESEKIPVTESPASKPTPEQEAPRTKAKPTSPPSAPKSKPQVTLGDSANRIILSKIEIEKKNAHSTFLTYDGDLQGAIVALTLGLTVTAVLLIFVVCKLRNVKRRLRRGRLASNDADYLINGMYL